MDWQDLDDFLPGNDIDLLRFNGYTPDSAVLMAVLEPEDLEVHIGNPKIISRLKMIYYRGYWSVHAQGQPDQLLWLLGLMRELNVSFTLSTADTSYAVENNAN